MDATSIYVRKFTIVYLSAFAAIAGGMALAVGPTLGADVNTLDEVPIQAQYDLSEKVTIEQKGDVVEATLPWKDQKGLKVKYDMGAPTAKEKRIDKRKKQVVVEQVGTDAFKIDLLLNEKPATNKFCYTIEGWEDYDFFYQPALTPEEIADGAERPEEIVGSYAVYHKTLKNHAVGKENYETGKVAHIPYPYVWSANATSTKHRAEGFEITNGQMCVTVSQSDLDTMEYPIRVDPTFGYTTAGASNYSSTNALVGTRFTVPSDMGTFQKLTARKPSGGFAGNWKGVITNSSRTIITNGVGNSVSAPAGPNWTDLTYTNIPTLASSTDYFLGLVHQGLSSPIAYDTGGTANYGNTDGSNNFTTPTNPSDGTLSNRRYSIYATYTRFEHTAKRTYNSKTFPNQNGSYTTEIHSGDIHYKENGVFVDSDISYTDKGTYWEMSKHNYHLRVMKNFANANLLQFDNVYDGASSTITYEPTSIVWYDHSTGDIQPYLTSQSATGTVSGNVIKYTNAFGTGVDFEVTLRRDGFKKEIVIPNKPASLPTPPGAGYKLYALFKYTGEGLGVKKADGTVWDKNTAITDTDGFVIYETGNTTKRTYIAPAYGVDSATTVPRMVNLNVVFMLRNGSLWQAKEIPLDKMEQATYPVRFDTTTNYTPSSDDSMYSGDATWATARGATSGTLRGGVTAIVQAVAGYYIERAFLTFDTSAIPDTDTVDSAYLRLSAKRHVGSAGRSYNVYNSTHSDTVAAGDFDLAGTTAYCDTALTQAGMTTGYANYDFTFNASGIAAISKTGKTKVAIRDVTKDVDNSAPSDEVSMIFQTVESAADPILSVTYSTPSGGGSTSGDGPKIIWFE